MLHLSSLEARPAPTISSAHLHHRSPCTTSLSRTESNASNWMRLNQRDARCRVSSSRHRNRFPRAIRDLILSPERQKMRRGSPTKLQKSHPRRFTLAWAYVFWLRAEKIKLKKQQTEGGGISELRGKKVFQPPKSCAARHRGTIKALKHSHSHSFSFFSFFCV